MNTLEEDDEALYDEAIMYKVICILDMMDTARRCPIYLSFMEEMAKEGSFLSVEALQRLKMDTN
jgi:hypothetical protein